MRLERAGAERSVNQSATMGFSANLAYATTRCETFGSYLMGKQTLFNDKFSGGPGFYIRRDEREKLTQRDEILAGQHREAAGNIPPSAQFSGNNNSALIG